MKTPYRERSYSCIEPNTYKYFLASDAIEVVWQQLATTYGSPRIHATLPIIEVRTDAFTLRAPESGTPITVIRTTSCDAAHLARLHEIFGFESDPEDDPVDV